MQFFITATEPQEIKELFEDTAIETVLPGFDFMLQTKKGRIGIERKQVPGDLLASVADGRLSREIVAMREHADIQIVLLHGTMHFHPDGTLIDGRQYSRWTRAAIDNLKRTLQYVEGIFIEEAPDDDALVDLIPSLQDYFDKLRHTSIKSRPALQKGWIIPTEQERIAYFFQGIPSCSAVRARLLMDTFGTPDRLMSASIDEIAGIRRFGNSLAKRIHQFLHQSSHIS